MPAGGFNRRSDDDLLRLIAGSRELEPFDALVQRHECDLYRVVYLLTGSDASARQWTVDVFCRIYRDPGAFIGRGPFECVLYAAALDVVESQRGGGKKAPSSADEEASGASIGGTDGAGHRLLMGALERLKQHHRAAFVLSEYEGLNDDDVARIMNTSASAIKSWVQRARLSMAEAFGAVEVSS